MTPDEHFFMRISRLVTTEIKFSMAAVLILLIVSGCARNAEDPFPKEIQGVKLGASKAEVIGAIENAGNRSEGPVPKRRGRIRLSWAPKSDPKFDRVAFDFTELNHLYAIRLSLRPGQDPQERTIRNALLQKYNIPDDFPEKMRFMNDNVMAFVGRNEVVATLFEFTNMVSGRKIYEIFDRRISADDFRKAAMKKAKEHPEKKGAAPPPTTAPEDQVGWGKSEKARPEASPKTPTEKEPRPAQEEQK